MELKAWRDLITPHDNILNGTFQEAEFAADLNKVASGTATPEYQDPVMFFERTFITEGMRLLLHSVIRRLTGNGGDPVIQLQTAFGGGKTHAMLAVYHLAKGEKPASELHGCSVILDDVGVSDVPKARVAMLDGNALSPSIPRKRKKIEVNTIWGEMAMQLGGEEAYRLLEQADKDGTSPGKETLAELFRKCSPCIVLMDETVAYVRQFKEGENYNGGTYGSNMAFLQALTEAAGQVPTAMVLASLPESDMEAGGELGRQALRSIEHLFHRLEAIWKPVAPEEGFEIVRRRLFQKMSDTDGRNAVCRAFADAYAQGDEYPSRARESKYYERLQAAYPIHPEVFDRLYEDWSALESFQRTRGVLRLMAMIIHRLWSDGNQDLMILPSSIPLYDTEVKNEAIRYLPQGWEPVLDRDVDGSRAITTEIDEKNGPLGSVQAARRVARSIFLGSAPSGALQTVRGVSVENIRLGCFQPDNQVGRFDDALRRLTDQLHYLYSGNNRYWYDTQTNLRREAEDRMARFTREEHLMPEIGSRLRRTLKGKPFAGVHVFTQSDDIPDDMNIRLVVLSPACMHQWHNPNSAAIVAAKDVQNKRGDHPRHNQNRLLYLAPDESTTANLLDQTKRFLAWSSIVEERDALNLDQHRLKEARKNKEDADDRVNGTIDEAYKWILTPYDEQEKNDQFKRRWEEYKIPETNQNKIEAIEQMLKEQEVLISQWAPPHLKDILDTWYWKDDRHDYPLDQIWDDFCRYPYLPRLLDANVLQNTVSDGMQSRDFFGYATGKDGKRYLGLRFGEMGSVYMDKDSILVHEAAARAQVDAEPEKPSGGTTTPKPGTGGTGSGGGTGTPPGGGEEEQETQHHHFHGSVELEASRASLQFSEIYDELIRHFTGKREAKVILTLDIDVHDEGGFDEAVVRVVEENGRTLNLSHSEFE